MEPAETLPDNRKPLIYGAFPVCRNYTVRAHIRNHGTPERRGRENRQQYARSLLSRLHAGHLRPRYHRRAAESGPDHGGYPLRRCLMLSAIHSRWGQRLGPEKATGENGNLCKTKIPEILRFRGFLARREGFEPPAFWSVGCLTHKSEPFRLRFVLFAAVYWMAFPLFPFSSAHSNSNLGQKWVKISPQAVFRTEMSYLTRRECQWNHKRGRNFANFPHSST